MLNLTDEQAFEIYLKDAAAPFSGWDFSYISASGRMRESLWEWSYTSVILPLVRSAGSMLDMGTGGGEFLASLQPLPATTVATEGYPPNLPVARERLEPLGVRVSPVGEDDRLPLDDDSFDLVINRHESYDPAEVLRVLKPGGLFVTQQVGGEDDLDLNRLLGADDRHPYAHWTAEFAANQLGEHGWDVTDVREAFPFTRYFDIGAIVYYLKAVPWQIESFSVEAYRDGLWELHRKIRRDGFVDIRNHRFLLVARG
ncbi:MAG: class I SAM-dependent methyltransferase [Thermomicrobiales bacterium]